MGNKELRSFTLNNLGGGRERVKDAETRIPSRRTDRFHIGFLPKDNAEVYAEKIFKSDLGDEMSDVGNQCHGGAFASTELGVSPMKKMNIIHDPKIKK